MNCDRDIECTAIVPNKSMNSPSLTLCYQLGHRQRGKTRKRKRGERKEGRERKREEKEMERIGRERGREIKKRDES